MDNTNSFLRNVSRTNRPFWIMWMLIFFAATIFEIWLGFQEGFGLKIVVSMLVHAAATIFIGVALKQGRYDDRLFNLFCYAAVLLAIFCR